MYTGADDAAAIMRPASRGVNSRPVPSRKKPGVKTIVPAGRFRRRCCSSSAGKPAMKSSASPLRRSAALGAQGRLPFPVPRTGAGDERQPARRRMPAQRLLHRPDDVVGERRAEHVVRQRRHGLQVSGCHRHVHDGDAREQLGPMAQHEVERLGGPGDDDVRRQRGVFLTQVGDEGAFVVLAAEAGLVEEFGRKRDRPIGPGREPFEQATVARDIGRQQPAIRVEHQYIVRRARRQRRRTREQQADDERPHRVAQGAAKPDQLPVQKMSAGSHATGQAGGPVHDQLHAFLLRCVTNLSYCKVAARTTRTAR